MLSVKVFSYPVVNAKTVPKFYSPPPKKPLLLKFSLIYYNYLYLLLI
jgi:hypothetical protein